MFPNITIQIKNSELALFLYTAEDKKKKLTIDTEDFRLIIINLARKLNLIDTEIENKDIPLGDLFNTARKADELFIKSFPEINLDDSEFNLSNLVNSLIDNLEIESPYKLQEMDLELSDELTFNQNADIFASTLDYIYIIIAAKAVVTSSDLGIGNIRLSDENKNSRMQEKVALELENVGVELIIE